jgi:hypothetical protein
MKNKVAKHSFAAFDDEYSLDSPTEILVASQRHMHHEDHECLSSIHIALRKGLYWGLEKLEIWPSQISRRELVA